MIDNAVRYENLNTDIRIPGLERSDEQRQKGVGDAGRRRRRSQRSGYVRQRIPNDTFYGVAEFSAPYSVLQNFCPQLGQPQAPS